MNDDELEHIWSRVQQELARAVGEPTYRTWLEDLNAFELVDGRLRVESPPQAHGWIQDRFGRVIKSCVRTVAGPGVALELVGAGGRAQRSGADRRPARARANGSHPRGSVEDAVDEHLQTGYDRGEARSSNEARSAGEPRSGPLGNPKLSFDQFVIGDSNRLAHAAALTVAEMPAQAYNPLFICGPPGVGKTHLLGSIATLLTEHNPGLIVRCTTGEEFTNEFLGALSGGHADGFKASFRELDVLLVNDVQFLERKTKTEEEFFHTFNALYDSGRQIVLSFRPTPTRPAGAGGPPARALRGRPRRRRQTPGARHPPGDLAQARAPRRHRAGRPGELSTRSPSASR